MVQDEVLRFRSFAERYVIERASKFVGTEAECLKDAYEAQLSARTLYVSIERMSRDIHKSIPRDTEPVNAQQAVPSGPPNSFEAARMAYKALAAAHTRAEAEKAAAIKPGALKAFTETLRKRRPKK